MLISRCEEDRGRLTGHHKVETSPNRTLVAEEVDTTSIFRLLLLRFRINLRTKGDTTAKDNIGSVDEVLRVDCFTFVAPFYIMVCSGTHLADVSCEGTFRVLSLRIFRRIVEVVFEGMLRLITIGVELNGGPCKVIKSC